jgi:hypothetical protein
MLFLRSNALTPPFIIKALSHIKQNLFHVLDYLKNIKILKSLEHIRYKMIVVHLKLTEKFLMGEFKYFSELFSKVSLRNKNF